MIRTLCALALLLAAATPLAAQTPTPQQGDEELVDRVVAVVGDTVLLLSDVQGTLQELQAAGRLPSDPVQRDAVARQILESKVNDLILVEAARDANLQARDDDVRQMVEQDIRAVMQRFGGSEVQFAQALATSGMTVAQYRYALEQRYRDQQLIEQLVRSRMASRARPVISEEQIRAAFEERKASLGTRPATVSLRQVIVKPEPSDSARAKAVRTAEEVLDELRSGGNFEVLARRFSEDPGSKEHGGDLGWTKPGSGLVPEFEQVAFALRPGEISPIVKTEFGYHIIKVDKVRGAERQIRHILIRPEITEADEQRARQRADSVATALREGANALSLARAYGTPTQEAEVTRAPVDRLPPAYAEAVDGVAAGAVVGPIEMEGPTGSSWAVIKVMDRAEAGAYTLDDVRDQLIARIQEERMMQQLVEDLRREVFVRIAM